MVKIGLFLLSIALGLVGGLTNRVEFVICASGLIGITFFEKSSDINAKVIDFIPKEFDVEPNRLIIVCTLFIYAGLCALTAAFLAKYYPLSPYSLIPWIGTIGLLFTAGIIYDQPHPRAQWRKIINLDYLTRRKLLFEVLIVLFITAIAFALRSINLNAYPPMVHGDEGEMGMEALRALGKGDPLPLFGTGWFNFPNLFFYLQAGSLSIFGQNIIGLRMLSALFGTGCIPIVYFIARKYWGIVAGFISAWLMAISHFSIQYSRLGINNIESVFFTILFILLFLSSFESKGTDSPRKPEVKEPEKSAPPTTKVRLTNLIAAGVIGGLSQYMYIGSRLIPIITIIFIIYLLVHRHISVTHISIIGFSAVAVFAPLGLLFLQSPSGLFFDRMNGVSIINPSNVANIYGPGISWAHEAVKILLDQTVKNIRFFIQSGDASAFYLQDLPAFDYLTATLFWLGLGFVISCERRFNNFVLLIWFGIGLVFMGILTNDSPNGPRLLVITPVVFIIAGVFMQRIWDELKNLFKRIPGVYLSPGWLVSPLFICLLISTMVINLNTYFNVYATISGSLLPIYLAREIVADAPTDHVYLLGSGDIYSDYGTIRFVAGPGKVSDLSKPEDLPPLPEDGKGTAILITGSHFAEVEKLQALFPDDVVTEKKDPVGRIIFMKFYIPPTIP
jgi:hypothetical protein